MIRITGRGPVRCCELQKIRRFLVWALGVVREGFMEEGGTGAGPGLRALGCTP